jgi:asparagine synthase (glutamine-hydrolysing)
MCGICGVFNMRKDGPVSRRVLTRMNALLVHRGPDGSGIYLRGCIGFGHRRLAVIDVAKGEQPLANEDGTVRLIYNGEIYNHKELQAELVKKGHRFITDCDTEVIVHAYEEYGPACVLRFNGMFAFALWDETRERLFLARDRLGIKPLYYLIRGRYFIFASEIKAILTHPEVSVQVDINAVPEYLLCTSLLESRTMFKDIRSLPPGTTLVIESGVLREQRYWSLERDAARHSGASFRDCRERVRTLLDAAVGMQVVSDVPFGTLLSGGLDSSVVAALAARHVSGRLKTIAMDFDKNGALPRDGTDAHFAGLVAAAYGTDHTEVLFQPQDYFDVMNRVTWHVEKPVDLTSPSLFLLYRAVKPKATVVASGEGSDELFAGYYFFLQHCQTEPREFPWAPYLEEISVLLDPAIERETGCTERIRATVADDFRALEMADCLNRLLFLFLKYYLVEMLERLDKTSMAWGVESRVPFLDHRLVEYVVNLPSAYKSTPESEKVLLKSIATELLPADIIKRKKRPVPIPVDPATVFRERNRANELVQAPGSRIGSYFNKKSVDDFFHKRARFATMDNLALYRTSHALIALDSWHRTFGVSS